MSPAHFAVNVFIALFAFAFLANAPSLLAGEGGPEGVG
jgi:hypothetical protein